MKKYSVLLISIVLMGCGASKPKIQTTKQPVVVHKEVYKKKKGKPDQKIVTEQGKKSQTETLEATSKIKVTTEVVNAYIKQFKEVAKTNMKNHGIPASIILAQGILESGAGTGALCSLANNHFGIKCHNDWSGPSINYDDDALQECFRKYEHAEESYRDHALFLTGRSRYVSLFSLEKDDYKGWATGLKKAGYATDPKYPDKLIGLIERYQLQQYDAEVLGKAYIPTPKNKDKETVVVQDSIKNQPITDNLGGVLHTVSQGETLYSISKKYSLSVDELKAKNKLTDNAISIGQTLIIK